MCILATKVVNSLQIQTDTVVREGKGYPTTEEEMAEHEANEEIMLRAFRLNSSP